MPQYPTCFHHLVLNWKLVIYHTVARDWNVSARSDFIDTGTAVYRTEELLVEDLGELAIAMAICRAFEAAWRSPCLGSDPSTVLRWITACLFFSSTIFSAKFSTLWCLLLSILLVSWILSACRVWEVFFSEFCLWDSSEINGCDPTPGWAIIACCFLLCPFLWQIESLLFASRVTLKHWQSSIRPNVFAQCFSVDGSLGLSQRYWRQSVTNNNYWMFIYTYTPIKSFWFNLLFGVQHARDFFSPKKS